MQSGCSDLWTHVHQVLLWSCTFIHSGYLLNIIHVLVMSVFYVSSVQQVIPLIFTRMFLEFLNSELFRWCNKTVVLHTLVARRWSWKVRILFIMCRVCFHIHLNNSSSVVFLRPTNTSEHLAMMITTRDSPQASLV